MPVFAQEVTGTHQAIKIEKQKKQPEKNFELEPYWENYGDNVLNGYIEEALENNLSIKMAEARIKESEAILGTINAQRLPQLSIIQNYFTLDRQIWQRLSYVLSTFIKLGT